MNLHTLKNFIAIVEAGSIRDAAENLHIAQSALSRQVLALERQLGTSLLMRLPRGVEPTEAGRVFLRHARAMTDQAAAAASEISALEGLQAGHVRIAVIEPFADQFLPDCISRFQAQYPGIGFEVRVAPSRQISVLLRDGLVDYGVAYNAPRDQSIVVRAEVQQPMRAFVRAGHPLAGITSARIEDFADHPLILPPEATPSRLLIDEAWRRASLPPMRISLESDSVGLRLRLTHRSDAVTILAQLSGQEEAASGALVDLPLADPILSGGRLALLGGKGRFPSRPALQFERLLRAAMKGAGAGGSDLAETASEAPDEG